MCGTIPRRGRRGTFTVRFERYGGGVLYERKEALALGAGETARFFADVPAEECFGYCRFDGGTAAKTCTTRTFFRKNSGRRRFPCRSARAGGMQGGYAPRSRLLRTPLPGRCF